MGFLALIVAMWCSYLIMRSIRRTGFEIETLAFFLCSLGVSVTATATPDAMAKQIILMLAMFTGRLGPLTLFLLLSENRQGRDPGYPVIKIPLG